MMFGDLIIPILFFAVGFYAFYNSKKIAEKNTAASEKERRYKKWHRKFWISLFGESGGEYYLKVVGVVIILLGIMLAIISIHPQVLKSFLNFIPVGNIKV